MYHVIVFVIICATVGGTEDVGVFRGDIQGFLTLHQPSTWWEARKTCFLEGAVLASPENEFLLEAMSATLLAKSENTIFIHSGVHNTYSRKHFYSLEGTPLAKLPVPLARDVDQDLDNTHDPSTETCLSMHHNGMLIYNDCSGVRPYFCFKRTNAVVPAASSKVCKNGYKYESRTKSCYKFYKTRHTWSEAFGICSDDGGHLAIINSRIEADVLKDFYRDAKKRTGYDDEVVFIGFKEVKNQHRRLWMTIHGQSLEKAGYNKFHSGQPESSDTICGAMFSTEDVLDDFYCDRPRAFICEKAPIDG